MSAEVKREMTGLLAHQIDSFAEVLHQRDSARNAAVLLEQENSVLVDCMVTARKILDSMRLPCKCDQVGDEYVVCDLCTLRGLLADAEAVAA